MKDFLTGGALTALSLAIVIGLGAINPILPYVAFGLVVVVAYSIFIKGLVDAINRGEAPDFNVFTNPWF